MDPQIRAPVRRSEGNNRQGGWGLCRRCPGPPFSCRSRDLCAGRQAAAAARCRGRQARLELADNKGGGLEFAAFQGRGNSRVSKDDATEGFVQEVHQRVREEQLLDDLKRYGPWLAGLFVVFLLGIGGWQMWTEHQRQVAREESTAFRAAQE